MLIFDRFIEIYGQPFTTDLNEIWLTRPQFDVENKRKINQFRMLNGNAEKIATYQHLLNLATKTLQSQPRISLLTLFFNALTSEDSPADPRKACDAVTQLLVLNTMHQHDIRDLLDMGRTLFHSPVGLAAFLRLLCIRGVNTTTIIQSYLLQDYFSYHLFSLREKNNPIEQLYQLLSSYPETHPLAEAANQIHSEERGFKTFCVNGNQTTEESSSFPERIAIPLNFTPTASNLSRLHALFETDGIVTSLLQWSFQKSNHEWLQWMTIHLNQHEHRQELPIILGKLYEYPILKPALATLLTPETIHQLIEQRDGHILSLIPWLPHLARTISSQNLSLYLTNIRQRAASGECLIIGLMELFEATVSENAQAAQFIMEALLDVILQELFVLEDETIVYKLRKYDHFTTCAKKLVTKLDSNLNELIETFSKLPLGEGDYITLEDTWRHNLIKIQAMQDLVKLKTECPEDQYQLYMRVAKMIYATNPGALDFKTLALSMNIAITFSTTEVTVYERFLIELVTGIDDETLRINCITDLDAAVKHRSWRSFLYGQQNVYERAVMQGNIGLVTYLDSLPTDSKITYDTFAINAARQNQWPMVIFLHQHHHLSNITNNLLLHLAVSQGAAHAIISLWSNSKNNPKQEQIDQAFLLAVRKGDVGSLRSILLTFKARQDNVMTLGFKQSINLKQWHAAISIAEYKRSKRLDEAFKDTVIRAARIGQIECLSALLPLCPLSLIEHALLAAARANQGAMIDTIMANPLQPRMPVRERAWNEAKKRKRTAIVISLAQWCQHTPPPSPKRTQKMSTTSPGMQRASSCGALIERDGLLTMGLFRPALTEKAILSKLSLNRQISF